MSLQMALLKSQSASKSHVLERFNPVAHDKHVCSAPSLYSYIHHLLAFWECRPSILLGRQEAAIDVLMLCRRKVQIYCVDPT